MFGPGNNIFSPDPEDPGGFEQQPVLQCLRIMGIYIHMQSEKSSWDLFCNTSQILGDIIPGAQNISILLGHFKCP